MKTLREFLEESAEIDEAMLGGEKYKGKPNPHTTGRRPYLNHYGDGKSYSNQWSWIRDKDRAAGHPADMVKHVTNLAKRQDQKNAARAAIYKAKKDAGHPKGQIRTSNFLAHVKHGDEATHKGFLSKQKEWNAKNPDRAISKLERRARKGGHDVYMRSDKAFNHALDEPGRYIRGEKKD